MKNTFNLFAIIALVAVIGFSFFACSSTPSNPGSTPELVGLYLSLYPDVGPRTEFTATDGLCYYIAGRDQDKDVKKAVALCKNDSGIVVLNRTTDIRINSISFNYSIGTYKLAIGNYTLEVYVIDSKGNISNTLSTDFKVK